MIFKLDGYHDCGKCAMGTLLEEFNTDTDKVFLNGKQVEITCIEDLFPFLWNIGGMSASHDSSREDYFYDTGTWWHSIYDGCIIRYQNENKKLEKKLKNPKSEKLKLKYQIQIHDNNVSIKGLQSLLDRCDNEMKEQQKMLINLNKDNK